MKIKLPLTGPKQKTFVALIALAVVLFVAEQIGVLTVLQDPLQKAFLPAQLALYKTRGDFARFFTTLTEIGSLRKRESDLATENGLLLAENARLKKLEAENKVLTDQLSVKGEERQLIAAQVIGTDPLLGISNLLVDKGRDNGVAIGAFVILKDILIGQVVAVGSSTASVSLLSDPTTKIPAVTQSGAKGILQGEFGSRILLDKVIQGEKLSVGEIVFTLGEADFPKGLVLGKITELKTDPAALFQKATVEPLVPFRSLEMVFVIKKSK